MQSTMLSYQVARTGALSKPTCTINLRNSVISRYGAHVLFRSPSILINLNNSLTQCRIVPLQAITRTFRLHTSHQRPSITHPFSKTALHKKHQRSRTTTTSSLHTLNTATASTASGTTKLLAVIIGWIVVAGSMVRSLPQIIRIVRNKSVEGLSMTSFISELIAYTITVAYSSRFGFPFSTWGDALISSLQHVAIVGLIFHYNKEIPTKVKIIASIIYTLFTIYMFSSSLCNESTLKVLQTLCIAILALGGRVPQIVLNIKRGNSGELSIISTGLSLAGNVCRIFTTSTLVGDPIIMANSMTQFFLNATLLTQTLVTARQRRGAIAAAAGSG